LVILQDLSQSAITDALKDHLQYIENERTKERDYMMDFYEGINMDEYVARYFTPETLRQAPILNQNLTKRVCNLRGMTYKRAPKLDASDAYMDRVDKFTLQAERRQLERLTFLLGTMAFRSMWNEATQKVEYQCLPHFEPLFLAGDRRDQPVGICYPIEYQGMARLEKPLHAVWTADRPGQPGQHYLLDEHGQKISVNELDRNPYGVLPVTFCHRHPPIRDFWSGSGAMDVVSVDLAVCVAQFELQLAVKYGAMGIKYLTNVEDASRVQIGVDKLLYLPPDSELKVTNPGGSLVEIVDATRFLVESCLNNNHIRAKYARNDSGNAPSAASLAIMELESTLERDANTEDTWRPWEHRRYEVDKAILQVEANINVGDDYSVDFLEPNYALDPQSEIAVWEWRFNRGLASEMDWFDYMNSDAPESKREAFKQMQAERTEQDQTPQNRLLNRLQNDANTG